MGFRLVLSQERGPSTGAVSQALDEDALLTLLFLATASQVLAAPLRANRNQPPTVTCATVRAYVSLLGLAQAQSDGASQRHDSCARRESNAVPRGRELRAQNDSQIPLCTLGLCFCSTFSLTECCELDLYQPAIGPASYPEREVGAAARQTGAATIKASDQDCPNFKPGELADC